MILGMWKFGLGVLCGLAFVPLMDDSLVSVGFFEAWWPPGVMAAKLMVWAILVLVTLKAAQSLTRWLRRGGAQTPLGGPAR